MPALTAKTNVTFSETSPALLDPAVQQAMKEELDRIRAGIIDREYGDPAFRERAVIFAENIDAIVDARLRETRKVLVDLNRENEVLKARIEELSVIARHEIDAAKYKRLVAIVKEYVLHRVSFMDLFRYMRENHG